MVLYNFKKTINKTEEQLDKTTDEAEGIELRVIISGLEEGHDKVIEKRELGEVKEQQLEYISRLQRFKEWAKEIIDGLSALAITVGGI